MALVAAQVIWDGLRLPGGVGVVRSATPEEKRLSKKNAVALVIELKFKTHLWMRVLVYESAHVCFHSKCGQ